MAFEAPSSYVRLGAWPHGLARPARLPCVHRSYTTKEHIMGKYVLAWALGVPAVVVVIAYLLFH